MIAKSKPNSKTRHAPLSEAVRKSMLQIWQAGLGAFSKTQSEGSEAFAKLVNEGAQLQYRTRELACAGASELADSARKIAGDAGKQASESLGKVETRLEKGVADALRTLGVPVRKDLHALTERIEKLSASIEALTNQKRAALKKGPAKTTSAAKSKIQAPRTLGKRASGSMPTRP